MSDGRGQQHVRCPLVRLIGQRTDRVRDGVYARAPGGKDGDHAQAGARRAGRAVQPKRLPDSGLRSNDLQWDFWTASPESAHQVMILMSDHGTPASYASMNGYGSHPFSTENAAGTATTRTAR